MKLLRFSTMVSKERLVQLEKYLARTTILFLLESAFEIIISGYLNFLKVKVATLGDVLSISVAIICFGGCVVWLPWFLATKIVLTQEPEKLNTQEAQQYIGPAYEGIRIRSRQARAFNLVFLLRRILYIGLAIFLSERIGIQVIGVISLNLMSTAYLVSSRPQMDRKNYRIELFNDITICLVSYSLSIFTNYVTDPDF